MPVRIAVLASGGGSNLQALIDRFHDDPDAPARVALLIASRPGIGALQRAEHASIPSIVLDTRPGSDHEGWLMDALDAHRIDLVILAGYLRQVPDEVVERYRNRILNIHPALLPGFGGQGMYGARVHRAVLAAGVKISGATVHLVDERYDEGEIVAQWPVPVLPGDTVESLAARVLRVEHLLLPAVVEALARGRAAEPLSDPLAFRLDHSAAPPPIEVATLTAASRNPTHTR